ncbi:cytochrome c oxidase assembly protein [Actinomadura sp. HBU206391]|uniref:cytochrome c oxidase assembly protein n=1 Tax=Actinomadura sp. HBU206391 TaxID=2731692 RepID=UPI00164F3219|nr:cytochrome c oxidase assembly protein [Actinomadura sp. HBU206391]MBC6460675.1 cytochrome c oxidase assembly protein [Actinomadura sp. HBU206391]
MSAHAHEAYHHGGGLAQLLPLAAVALLLCGYLVPAARRRREARGWSTWRTASHVTGVALLAVALAGPVASFAHTDFRGHMLQHLLIGMFAPLALALGAPMTLLLRSLRPGQGRRLGKVLRGRACHVFADSWVALTLNVGGLAVLYFTPLYRITSTNAVAHQLVHVHFLLSGYLFAWVIAGPDPAPRRRSVPTRLLVLGVAIAVHATLAQLMYAGLFVDVPVPAQRLRGAAEIMYYGGDIAELLLALALVTTWRPVRPGSRRPAPAPVAAVRIS